VGGEELSDAEGEELLQLCRQRLDAFRMQRGEEVFAHRSRHRTPISGSIKYRVSRVNPLGRFATTKLAGECPQVVAGDNLGAATRKLSYPAARSLISTGFS
jgi:hypothetical protein